MRLRTCLLPLVAGLTFAGAASAQVVTSPAPPLPVQPAPPPPVVVSATPPPTTGVALTEEQIKTRIADAGFKMVKGLEFEDGVWRTEARGGNDHWVSLVVAPVTGKVYLADAPSHLNADEITAALSAQGYEDIGDVEFEDGLWSADAVNRNGVDVDLLVDPDNGSVVVASRD